MRPSLIIYKAVFIFIFSVVSFSLFAQQPNKPLYQDGSRVCFIGNSITNNGEFYNNLWLYYATRFPKDKIMFYNCGISGDVAGGVIKRMDKDIFIHQPTHAVMMIGMNDVKRNLYGKNNGPDSLKRSALDLYRKNTDRAVSMLKEKTKAIVLLKPSIYDQTSTLETENLYGVNDALQQCGTQMAVLSKKYETGLVDFQTIMLQINAKEQQGNPAFTIVGNDRVHPMSAGHFVMTYQFLKDTKAPQYVSRIYIDKDLAGSLKNSFNCNLKKLEYKGSTLSFECLENSLPFPVKESAQKALNWVPFQETFNTELLQVNGLETGNYQVFIDQEFIATSSDTELRKGINLALLKNTPQYKQALEVLALCLKYRETESVIRNLRFVEFNHLAELKVQGDLATAEKYLNERLETLKDGGHYEYYQKQFKNYILKKGDEAETLKKLSELAENLYKVNQPKTHTFKITRQN